MIILPNDPLSEFFSKSSLNEKDINNSFISWKFMNLKESPHTRFIRLKNSSYILAVELFSSYQTLFGLWNVDTDQGYLFEGYSINLSKSKIPFDFIPTEQLSESSEYLYSKKDQIELWAFELTKSMLNSKEHLNKTSDEIAIKAVRVASSLRQRISEYNELRNSMI